MLLVLAALTVGLWAALATMTGARIVTGVDLAAVRLLERARFGVLTDVAEAVALLGSPILFRVVAWATLLTLLALRRFQHLFVVLAALLVVPVLDAAVAGYVGRMRPAGVEILWSWEGYAHPSRPVASLAVVLTAATLVLVPSGPWRRRAIVVVASLLVALGLARCYLAVDHPSDVAAALVVGTAIPIVALRMLTPEEAFPVTFHRGVRAHLDVDGARGEAIRSALSTQMGITVTEVRPFALGGSAGSTPLRITLQEPPGQLFGKLYAATHLWSDRWYKLARTVLYGRLEDERPFNAVRRLVQYEDHMLRVMRDAGIRTAAPHGIVEITPEREYLILTDFLEGAVHITDAEVDDGVVDDALGVVRRLWRAGLAHRDIKPANILVLDGQVWLIDVAFAEVRPTPWRQAVDLANMLLTLALCTGPEHVYGRALLVFTPDEMAEAFAASRSVTIPAQLRTMLRARDDDIIGRFRHLAPPRRAVSIQRWTIRRAVLTLGVLVAASVILLLVASNLRLAGLL